MPLAVVVTELLQNAVAHAYPEPDETPGQVVVELGSTAQHVRIRVCDDGAGLPSGFRLDEVTGLGLTIVRTFIVDDLGGSIAMRDRDDGPGTVVELSVPLSSDRT